MKGTRGTPNTGPFRRGRRSMRRGDLPASGRVIVAGAAPIRRRFRFPCLAQPRAPHRAQSAPRRQMRSTPQRRLWAERPSGRKPGRRCRCAHECQARWRAGRRKVALRGASGRVNRSGHCNELSTGPVRVSDTGVASCLSYRWQRQRNRRADAAGSGAMMGQKSMVSVPNLSQRGALPGPA
jgi:hypothetical protein